MRFFTTKRSIVVACAIALGVAALTSCGGNSGQLSDAEVQDLQKQLDSTLDLYLELKSQSGDFSTEMATRDSVITAQAAEIQRLLDQMSTGKATAKDDRKATEAQQNEIREKEKQINQLRKQLEAQEKQIKDLRAKSEKAPVAKDESASKKQIESLRNQIAQQERQIAELKAQTTKTTDCSGVEQRYQSQMNDLNGQVKNYKQQVNELQRQLNTLNAQVASMQTSAGQSNDEAAKHLAAVQTQLATAKAELTECQTRSSQLQQDAKQAQQNYASAVADLEKCRADLAAQAAQVKSLQISAEQGGKSESQLRAELAAMAQNEAKLRAQNEELTKSQNTLNAKCAEDKAALNSSIKSLEAQIGQLQDQIAYLTAENGRLTADGQKKVQNEVNTGAAEANLIADLSAQLDAQKAEIASLQQQLEQRSKELAAVNAAKTATPTKGAVSQKLAELQTLCDSYAAEIERLRAENEQLRSENSELRDKVASSADLIAENERLQQKVNLASVLVTSDLVATPGKSVKGNIVKPATKAAQTMAVRIDCRILDNNVVDPGSITIYARIANAANRVLCNGSADVYSFDLNGVQMQYTAKQDIEFTGYSRNLTMLWKKDANMEMAPGLYWVTLYANGYEIGKTSFRLN